MRSSLDGLGMTALTAAAPLAFGSLYLAKASQPGSGWAATAIALVVTAAVGAGVAALASSRSRARAAAEA